MRVCVCNWKSSCTSDSLTCIAVQSALPLVTLCVVRQDALDSFTTWIALALGQPFCGPLVALWRGSGSIFMSMAGYKTVWGVCRAPDISLLTSCGSKLNPAGVAMGFFFFFLIFGFYRDTTSFFLFHVTSLVFHLLFQFWGSL